jgi:hypothetical protein
VLVEVKYGLKLSAASRSNRVSTLVKFNVRKAAAACSLDAESTYRPDRHSKSEGMNNINTAISKADPDTP